ncbi:MAG: hypothetical protein ACLSF2_07275 [Butyricicoccus sp.]
MNPQAAQAAARLSRQLRQDETCLQSYAQTCVQLCAVGNGAWKIQPLREAAPAVAAERCGCCSKMRICRLKT